LQVINIRNDEAVRLALQLKKALVDTDRLEISQEELEHTLFAIMHSNGYGAEFVSRYSLVTAFNKQRLPVIILIAGTPFSGKTSLATLLRERLNAPSLIQSLLVYEVVRSLGRSHPDFSLDHDLPSWLRPHSSYHSFLEAFKREGSMVRQGLEGDLSKCLEEVQAPPLKLAS
jgi:2-phosphoglycerate kinase